MSLRQLLVFAFLAILAMAAPAALGQQSGALRPVLLTEVDGVIGPPSAHQIKTAIEEAEARDAEALILQLNTPGGLETSMRDIIEDILAAQIPVIGYVAPSGGRAASAGTFIIYATHYAAMAPGTNIGAATPVELGGGEAPSPDDNAGEKAKGEKGEEQSAPTNSDALDRKAVNDSVAFIRSLAALRGRNADWGERAVRLGEAVAAAEAVELGVVETLADNVDDLLAQLDGQVIALPGGERQLSTRGRALERIEPSWITQVLGVLANPNVAFLLMLIGVYGMIYEFLSPGSIGPGVIGVVCLVLGLYALNQLPLNYAGLALILLGIGFMAAEAFTPTFGVLGIGGAIAFLIGAAMLIDTDIPEYSLNWSVILAALALTGGFILLVAGFSLRAHRRKVATGREAMLGMRAQVLDWAGGSGHVWVASERWKAFGPADLSPGAWVRVEQIEALTLRVAPEPAAPSPRPQGDAA